MDDTSDHDRDYQLSDQVGYNLRRANQRHVAIFAAHVKDFTPTQFATLARLHEHGAVSQNHLGRLTAMDSATIKGVVERLRARGLVSLRPDPEDQRKRLVQLTAKGKSAFLEALPRALAAREETIAPLSGEEVRLFETLLSRLV